ncbi:MAG: hypothetical protein FJ109_18965 [Deltaproteobacteria bacterium]|nr:hypothetical protein [Deltaproteobacteria bacterium]
MRKRFVALVLVGMSLVSGAALAADPFEGSDLLVGRSVKQPTGARRFALGVNVQFAPMNLVLSSQKDVFVDGTVAAACGDDEQCKANAAANVDAAMMAINTIPDDKWNDLTDTASNDAKLDGELDKLVDQGVIKESDKGAVQAYTTALPEGERKAILGLTRELAKQQATSLLVEPNMEINFKYLSLNVRVPLAVMMFEEETKWHMGNVALDTKFGHIWGSSAAAFGLGYGLSVFVPSGTREAGGMATADLWYGPKFMHGYMSLDPYLAMGFDSIAVSLQMHGELVNQFYVLGDPKGLPGSVIYAKYGGGLVFMPKWPVSLIAELNGMAPLKDAVPYSALFAIGGLQPKLFWLKASAAVQFPLIAPEQEDLGAIGGVSLGELASYSVIGRAAFAF